MNDQSEKEKVKILQCKICNREVVNVVKCVQWFKLIHYNFQISDIANIDESKSVYSICVNNNMNETLSDMVINPEPNDSEIKMLIRKI